MSKAQTDIRTTSYDANTANAVGYHGTLDDALAQVRAEENHQPTPRLGSERRELLRFLGVRQRTRPTSGIETHSLDTFHARSGLFETPADDSVEYYDADDRLLNALAAPSKYSLEFAIAQGWVVRVQS